MSDEIKIGKGIKTGIRNFELDVIIKDSNDIHAATAGLDLFAERLAAIRHHEYTDEQAAKYVSGALITPLGPTMSANLRGLSPKQRAGVLDILVSSLEEAGVKDANISKPQDAGPDSLTFRIWNGCENHETHEVEEVWIRANAYSKYGEIWRDERIGPLQQAWNKRVRESKPSGKECQEYYSELGKLNQKDREETFRQLLPWIGQVLDDTSFKNNILGYWVDSDMELNPEQLQTLLATPRYYVDFGQASWFDLEDRARFVDWSSLGSLVRRGIRIPITTPDVSPFVDSLKEWLKGLQNIMYGYITIQPYYGGVSASLPRTYYPSRLSNIDPGAQTIIDGYHYQVCTQGHTEAMGGVLPKGAEELGEGRWELTVGQPPQWIPDQEWPIDSWDGREKWFAIPWRHESNRAIREEARRLLLPLLDFETRGYSDLEPDMPTTDIGQATLYWGSPPPPGWGDGIEAGW